MVRGGCSSITNSLGGDLVVASFVFRTKTKLYDTITIDMRGASYFVLLHAS